MATFTEVYKQELKSKGVLSSLGSSVLKSTKERMDPRNVLFGGKGIFAATGQKIFGKGYSAIEKKKEEKDQSNDLIVNELIKQNMSLSVIGKNTMPLRAMSRDINVMRQNIIKLVKLNSNGSMKAATKADMFFKKQSEEEAAYENMLGKNKSPELDKIKKDTKGKKSNSAFDVFTKMILPIALVFGGLALAVTNGIDTIKQSFENIRTSIESVVNSILSSIGLRKQEDLIKPVDKPDEQIIRDLESIKFDENGNIVSGLDNSQAPKAQDEIARKAREEAENAEKNARAERERLEKEKGRGDSETTKARIAEARARREAEIARAREQTAQSQKARSQTWHPPPTSTSPSREIPPGEAKNAFDAVRQAMGGSESAGKYDSSFGDYLAKNGIINTKQLVNVMTPEKWSETVLGTKKKLTDFTLAEIQKFQEYRSSVSPGSGALGRYGFMPKVLFGVGNVPGLVQKLGLSMDTKFDKETQEKIQDLLVRGNIAILKSGNVPITPENIYMAQMIGPSGAVWIHDAIRAGQGDKLVADVLAERSKAKDPQEYKNRLLRLNPQLNGVRAQDLAPKLGSSLVNKGGLSQSLLGKTIDSNEASQVATASTGNVGKAEAVNPAPTTGAVVSQTAMMNTEMKAQTGTNNSVINVSNVTPSPQQGPSFNLQNRNDEMLTQLLERMVT